MSKFCVTVVCNDAEAKRIEFIGDHVRLPTNRLIGAEEAKGLLSQYRVRSYDIRTNDYVNAYALARVYDQSGVERPVKNVLDTARQITSGLAEPLFPALTHHDRNQLELVKAFAQQQDSNEGITFNYDQLLDHPDEPGLLYVAGTSPRHAPTDVLSRRQLTNPTPQWGKLSKESWKEGDTVVTNQVFVHPVVSKSTVETLEHELFTIPTEQLAATPAATSADVTAPVRNPEVDETDFVEVPKRKSWKDILKTVLSYAAVPFLAVGLIALVVSFPITALPVLLGYWAYQAYKTSKAEDEFASVSRASTPRPTVAPGETSVS